MNNAYRDVFKEGQLTLGLVMPIERLCSNEAPPLHEQIKRVQFAESLGFYALWLRDIPFHVPAFGDVGQVYDPFTYLGYLAASTQSIALAIASAILPLRHPAHLAKAIATVEELSEGRTLLGVASGDRPDEYPAFGVDFDSRGKLFRQNFEYLERVQDRFPEFNNDFGVLNGRIDLLPKQVYGKVPLLITGASQQSPEWLAQHGDGWITYQRDINIQSRILQQWRQKSAKYDQGFKPAIQSLYVDLLEDPNARPESIHLGFRCGIQFLKTYLYQLQEIGINHVALNLSLQRGDLDMAMQVIADELQGFLKP